MNEKHSFVIAVIILITVSIILVGTLLKSAYTNEVMSEHGKDLVSDIINSMIVIVSMIIGSKSSGKI